jgi:hypothetical protein
MKLAAKLEISAYPGKPVNVEKSSENFPRLHPGYRFKQI